MKVHTVITLVLLSILPTFAEYYEFTDAQGRAITAKPVRMVGTQVEIERDDGSKFTVNPSIFIAKDQKFLAQWARDQLISKGDAIKISAKSAVTRKQKDGSSTGLKIKRFKGYYNIQIKNDSDLDLNDLEVEYRYYIFKNQVGADKRSDGNNMRVTGDSTITLLAKRSEIKIETKKTEMKETDLESGYRWANGGKSKSKDQLDGIWIKLYQGDKVIAEFANPSTLPRKEKW